MLFMQMPVVQERCWDLHSAVPTKAISSCERLIEDMEMQQIRVAFFQKQACKPIIAFVYFISSYLLSATLAALLLKAEHRQKCASVPESHR